MNYAELAIECASIAVAAEVSVALFAFPVAVVKRLTQLERVKPFDCAMCMSAWLGLAWFGPDLTSIALAVLARQLFHRLLLF